MFEHGNEQTLFHHHTDILLFERFLIFPIIKRDGILIIETRKHWSTARGLPQRAAKRYLCARARCSAFRVRGCKLS